MTVTTTSLTRAAGISAAVAGAIFIAVQINHPSMDVSAISTTDFVVRNCAKALMTVLALAGITGMYLRQVRQMGVVGLAGYLLFAAGYLVMFSVEVIAAFVLPTVAEHAPGYVDDFIVAAAGGHPASDIGAMQTWFAVAGACYMLGGLVFGIALFRARVLARWAAALLAVATVSTAALAVLPESFNRPFAVPTGIALIGLGVSLWRDQRPTAAPAATTPATAPVERVR
jgi:hypothetical protein